MKPSIILAIALGLRFALIAAGSKTPLTADLLTSLPLYPATDSRLDLGNDPTRLPESSVCKSKMQADFYTVYDSKVDTTLLWYGTHLPSFKRTHAYAANRSQDTFYNAEGTISVSVTGSSGRAGENTRPIPSFTPSFGPPSWRKRYRAESAENRLSVTILVKDTGARCVLDRMNGMAGEREAAVSVSFGD